MKQFFYNHSRGKVETQGKSVKNPHKHLSVMSLFKQRYAKKIIARRDEMESSKDPAAVMRAYNKAVKLELTALEEESPDEFKELQDAVEELKASAEGDFEEHDDALKARYFSSGDDAWCLTFDCQHLVRIPYGGRSHDQGLGAPHRSLSIHHDGVQKAGFPTGSVRVSTVMLITRPRAEHV